MWRSTISIYSTNIRKEQENLRQRNNALNSNSNNNKNNKKNVMLGPWNMKMSLPSRSTRWNLVSEYCVANHRIRIVSKWKLMRMMILKLLEMRITKIRIKTRTIILDESEWENPWNVEMDERDDTLLQILIWDCVEEK